MCKSWLSLGFARGHEVAVGCTRPERHRGLHRGSQDGCSWTWERFYPKVGDADVLAVTRR